jgi:hypothetical protein
VSQKRILELSKVTQEEERNRLIQDLVKSSTEELIDRSEQIVIENNSLDTTVENEIEGQWGIPLTGMVLFVNVSRQINHYLIGRVREGLFAGKEELLRVMLMLQGNACKIASEMLTLVKQGHGTGAMARWRTLHEINVHSRIMVKYGCGIEGGGNLARRYLDHWVIEMAKLTVNYYKPYAEEMGLKYEDDRTFRDLEITRDKLCNEYGKDFEKDNGWARSIMGSTTFADLERLAKLDNLRFMYKSASWSIHPGSISVGMDLGVPIGMIGEKIRYPSQEVLMGPSTYFVFVPSLALILTLEDIDKTILNLDDSDMSTILKGLVRSLGRIIKNQLAVCQTQFLSKNQ